MSLDAMRQFKRETGKDLWFTLISFLDVFVRNQDESDLTLMRLLYETVDFETASHVFHCLAHAENSSLEVEQMQDAMFRVGWRPNELGEQAQPWPLVMYKVAIDIDKAFSEVVSVKKKAQTGEASTNDSQ